MKIGERRIFTWIRFTISCNSVNIDESLESGREFVSSVKSWRFIERFNDVYEGRNRAAGSELK